MSRIANKPVELPTGVEIKLDGQNVTAKGKVGEMVLAVHPSVQVLQDEKTLSVKPETPSAVAMAGTMRSLLDNLVVGVSTGFEKKLELVGVGYRAQAKGKSLNLSLGFSHPVEYPVPEGISIETPSQTEIVIKGYDKQRVGQVAAEIRAYRPPEPYKGKGVKYADERIIRKEAKKK
ncbi:MAG: 50S ribosomal protein L6 [Gammaproteobacteria bacterium TMED119]|nr:MAG: 50S ribosomal protein L6 [Gammaproteobacteria bacterium TMED119]RCL45990.1 MAG: 50S ribosomal protein L6 [Candidatus Thioglobus sp.]|tara:strand:+ start:263 stop:790 length:528 start_codon:yes stop_codon:yes gene_type:complete